MNIQNMLLIGAILTAVADIIFGLRLLRWESRHRLSATSVMWSLTTILALGTVTFFLVWCSIIVAPEGKDASVIGPVVIIFASATLCFGITSVCETIYQRKQQKE